MTPTIKKIIIAGIILAVIVICLVVYKKSKSLANNQPAPSVDPLVREQLQTATIDTPTGVAGRPGDRFRLYQNT